MLKPLLRYLLLPASVLVAAVTGWMVLPRSAPHPAPPSPIPPAKDEIVRVGNTSITVQEFSEAWARRQPWTDPKSAKSNVLEALIRRELLFAEAKRRGFTERKDLQNSWRSLVVSRFEEELEEQRTKAAPSTDDEIAAHYREHLAEYSNSERRRLAILVLPIPAAATQERRARLAEEARSLRDQAIAKSANPGYFGELAARYSAHQSSRYSGGDVGWLTRAQALRVWPEKVVEAAFSLQDAGEISPVLATDEGCYLLKLIDRQPGQPLPLEAVHDRIRQELARIQAAREKEHFLAALKQAQGVQIFAKNLDAAVPAETSLAHQFPLLPTP